MLFRSLFSIYFLLASTLCRVFQGAVTDPPLPSNDVLRYGELQSNNISPLEPRVLSDWQLTGLIIVSDIDGNLHGLNRKTGATLWTLPFEEPVVHTLGNNSQDDANSNLLWFVEPVEDGSLFYFSPEFGLNKLPTSIKNLVMKSPFSLNGDDKIYTGTRKTSLYTLNKLTGEVIKRFGLRSNVDSCPMIDEYLGLSQAANDDAANYIMLGKTTYELSIHSKIDSNIVWNVTYSHWGPNNIDNDLMKQNRHSVDKRYFTPFHDKSLLALSHALGAPVWMSRLSSLAVQVFDVFSHRNNGHSIAIPHPAKEFNALQHTADGADDSKLNVCFLNKTSQGFEWFAMTYANFPTLIKSAPTSQYQMALQQYENGFLDQLAIEQLRSLSVLAPEAEFFVSGLHTFGSFSSSRFHQPGPQFERDHRHNNVPDGSLNVIKPLLWNRRPGIMDGMLFPPSQETLKADLSIVDPHMELQAYREQAKEVMPVAFHKHTSPMDAGPVHKVLMLRRIAEDLIVMFTLVFFLMGFVKIAQKFKYLSPEGSKIIGSSNESAEQSRKGSAIPALVSEDDSGEDEVSIAEPKSVDDPAPQDTVSPSQSISRPVSHSSVGLVDDNGTETGDLLVKTEDNLDSADLLPLSKKKRKRGSRGGKRGGKLKKSVPSDDETTSLLVLSESPTETIVVDEDFEQTTLEDDEATPTISLVKTFAKPDNQLKKLQIDNNLVISNKVLGYGSHGTVVYEGTFENRPVAVKRMLFDFYDIANHEVRLLQESDDHPNVIRYFCSQSNLKEKFLYIALELCVCSLEDLIEKLKVHLKNTRLGTTSRNDLLHQLASGLSYLHSLKIVHRDLKPQNILLGESSKKDKHTGKLATRLLISDFGLCKKLDADQSSFGATTHNAASGTSGWRAPELLRPDINTNQITLMAEDGDLLSFTSFGNEKRLTKAIDIFSLGCVFFYILTDGYHPFGDRYLREANIVKGHSDLSILLTCCPVDYVEATHLIRLMIHADPKLRPDTNAILKHPFFWNTNKKLQFLLKVSDRFEVERRDPPSVLLLTLEKISHRVHKGDWLSRFDSDFTDNLGKYRKYHTEKVMDLLRALRNKYHHYNDMPPELQEQMSPLPSGFYNYFNQKFPHLLMEIYAVVERHLQEEHIFHEFF